VSIHRPVWFVHWLAIYRASPVYSLVQCGIAACGMRKVKCGMECAEYFCGTVGNMRNAESCPSRRSDAFLHGLQGAGVVVGVYRSSDVCL